MSMKLTLTIAMAIVIGTCFTNLASLTDAKARPYWRFCIKCRVMFATPAISNVCAAGGTHEPQGYQYRLPFDGEETATKQSFWRCCHKCGALFFNGVEGKKGRCPAGQGHAWAKKDGTPLYLLPHDVPGTPTAQPDWRFCSKCFAMFYDAFPEKGRCAAGGGHLAQGFNFVLPHGR